MTRDVRLVERAPVDPGLQKTAFNELSVAEPSPIVQVYAVNGLRDDMQQLVSGTGAQVYEDASNFVVESGTSAAGIATLLSVKQATYRPGQGLVCRITALFETSAPNSIQLAGLINAEDIYCFGFNGDSFGVLRAHDGAGEFQELLITTPAAGSENATITIDDVPYSVPITVGTTQHNAFEISEWLNGNVPGTYSFSSNNSTVSALGGLPIAAGAFAFSSATAVAAWTQITAGAPATFEWTEKDNWLYPPSWEFDPTKGNVYEIKMQYLGYGGIKFYLENPDTTELELVHIISYANKYIVPAVSNPTFRIGWVAQNLGNTTNLTLRGASAAAFVEGRQVFDERQRTRSETVLNIGTTQTNLITLRNRLHMNGSINRIGVYPILLIVAAVHNKAVIYHLNIGSSFAGDLDFTYEDEVNSAVEIATDQAAISSEGRQVAEIRIRSINPLTLDLTKIIEVIYPRETLTISANTDSGTATEVDYSIIWREDP